MPDPVLAVSGLQAEARIAAGAGVAVLAGGGDAARLALRLQAALDRGARAVISIGIAGGLHPDLRPGAALVARSVRDGPHRYAADPDWLARLEAALPDATATDLVGTDRAIRTSAEKLALGAATGAVAVDMESHVAARLAALHHVPFAAVRIVADPFDRGLPEAAIVGLRPDGSTDVGAVLRALRRRPSDLLPLMRAGLDARAAMAALRRCRARLTPVLNFDDGPKARPAGPRGAPGPDLGFGLGAVSGQLEAPRDSSLMQWLACSGPEQFGNSRTCFGVEQFGNSRTCFGIEVPRRPTGRA